MYQQNIICFLQIYFHEKILQFLWFSKLHFSVKYMKLKTGKKIWAPMSYFVSTLIPVAPLYGPYLNTTTNCSIAT